jgi:hypothetical protein
MYKSKKSTSLTVFITIIATIITAVIGGILGALGGAEKSSKQIRRIGIPVLLLILGLLLHNIASLFIVFWIAILYMGYGIPDSSDSGSVLGRFWYKICNKSQFWTNFFVKFTLGFFFSIILIPIAYFSSNMRLLFLTTPLAICSQVVFGSIIKGLGMITLFNKKLTGIEIARYLTLTLAGALQIAI